MPKKLTSIVLFLFIVSASFLLGKATPQIAAQSEPPPQSPEACLAEALTEYMNEAIDGTRNLGNIRLLSPAFNLTSAIEPVLFSYMNTFGANFNELYGFAGNTYTLDGKRAMAYYRDNGWAAAFGSKPVFFTEYGDFATQSIGSGNPQRDGLIASMQFDYNEALSSGIDSINYFSALSEISFNPEFINRHKLSEDELQRIVSQSPGSAGLNQGVGVTSGSEERKARELGLGWAVELITGPGDLEAVVASANSEPSINVIVRLCYGTSCGFEDAQTLIAFLKELNGRINKPIYVIAGPNEPASEPWVAPECQPIPGATIVGPVPGLPPASGNPPSAPQPPIDYTACNDIRNPEFHSLRPYPASPCNSSVYTETRMCAEDLTVREVFQVMPEDANGGCVPISETVQECTYIVESSIDFSVFAGTSRLPIVGNTELVPNSVSNENQLSNATRMNEYASWYLNGVTSRAEEEDEATMKLPFSPPRPEAEIARKINEVINFSGPLKKLLPFAVQNSEYEGIFTFGQTQTVEGLREAQARLAREGDIRHNQIVVCTTKTALVPLSSLDDFAPVPCYTENRNDKITRRFFRQSAGDLGIDRVIQYQPFLYGLNPTFSYIPFSSTEDITGQIGLSFKNYGGSINFDSAPSVDVPPPSRLYFPHMIEVNELANILQKTFTSSDFISYSGGYSDDEGFTPESDGIVLYGNPPLDQYYEQQESEYCSIETTRKNPGDLLYGGWEVENGQFVNRNANAGGESGDISYGGTFTCEFPLPISDPQCIAECYADPDCYTSCGADTPADECVLQRCPAPVLQPCLQYAEMSFNVESSTPLSESLWDRLVAGNYSVVRRMFPRVSPGAPVDEILDIPAQDNVWYSANNTSSNLPIAGTGPIAGDPNDLRPGSSARAYFPHIGSVHEYFLQGIQCALRPLGMCGNSGFSSGITPLSPTTPETGAQCVYTDGQIQSAMQAASAKYKVPIELLEAVYEIEAFTYLADRDGWQCTRNPYTAMGLMQVTDGTYTTVTCENERILDDAGMCVASGSALSRCDVNDIFELAARVLLLKVGYWYYGPGNCSPAGSISLSDTELIYRSACFYYGSCAPDQITQNYARGNIPSSQWRGGSYQNMGYADIVCAKIANKNPGFTACTNPNNYPDRVTP